MSNDDHEQDEGEPGVDLERELEAVELEMERREQRVNELQREHELIVTELARLAPRRNILSGSAALVVAEESHRIQLRRRLERKRAALEQARAEYARAQERRDEISREIQDLLVEQESKEVMA